MAFTQPQNAAVADPMRTAMEAISKGQDPAQAVYGTNAGFEATEEATSETDSHNPLEDIQESESEEPSSEHSETNSASQEDKTVEPKAAKSKAPEKAGKAAKATDTEELFVKGVDGKRQAIKIDYTDRESIKQAYLKAAGMRKFQLERDKASTDLKKVQGDFTKLKADMDKLEDIYSKEGVRGLVSKLGGDDQLKKLVEEEVKHREYLGSLTPSEKSSYEFKQQQETAMKKASALEESYRLKLEQIEQKEDQAVTRSLESRLHPAFDRYRFAGKLGDDLVEHQLDETVWNQATKRLSEYPDDVELTQALVDREFRAVSQNLQKVINVQAEKKVQKTVDKKKAEAANTAQVTAKRGLSENSTAKDKFINSIKDGDILSAMTQMNSGKIRL